MMQAGAAAFVPVAGGGLPSPSPADFAKVLREAEAVMEEIAAVEQRIAGRKRARDAFLLKDQKVREANANVRTAETPPGASDANAATTPLPSNYLATLTEIIKQQANTPASASSGRMIVYAAYALSHAHPSRVSGGADDDTSAAVWCADATAIEETLVARLLALGGEGKAGRVDSIRIRSTAESAEGQAGDGCIRGEQNAARTYDTVWAARVRAAFDRFAAAWAGGRRRRRGALFGHGDNRDGGGSSTSMGSHHESGDSGAGCSDGGGAGLPERTAGAAVKSRPREHAGDADGDEDASKSATTMQTLTLTPTPTPIEGDEVAMVMSPLAAASPSPRPPKAAATPPASPAARAVCGIYDAGDGASEPPASPSRPLPPPRPQPADADRPPAVVDDAHRQVLDDDSLEPVRVDPTRAADGPTNRGIVAFLHALRAACLTSVQDAALQSALRGRARAAGWRGPGELLDILARWLADAAAADSGLLGRFRRTFCDDAAMAALCGGVGGGDARVPVEKGHLHGEHAGGMPSVPKAMDVEMKAGEVSNGSTDAAAADSPAVLHRLLDIAAAVRGGVTSPVAERLDADGAPARKRARRCAGPGGYRDAVWDVSVEEKADVVASAESGGGDVDMEEGVSSSTARTSDESAGPAPAARTPMNTLLAHIRNEQIAPPPPSVVARYEVLLAQHAAPPARPLILDEVLCLRMLRRSEIKAGPGLLEGPHASLTAYEHAVQRLRAGEAVCPHRTAGVLCEYARALSRSPWVGAAEAQPSLVGAVERGMLRCLTQALRVLGASLVKEKVGARKKKRRARPQSCRCGKDREATMASVYELSCDVAMLYLRLGAHEHGATFLWEMLHMAVAGKLAGIPQAVVNIAVLCVGVLCGAPPRSPLDLPPLELRAGIHLPSRADPATAVKIGPVATRLLVEWSKRAHTASREEPHLLRHIRLVQAELTAGLGAAFRSGSKRAKKPPPPAALGGPPEPAPDSAPDVSERDAADAHLARRFARAVGVLGGRGGGAGVGRVQHSRGHAVASVRGGFGLADDATAATSRAPARGLLSELKTDGTLPLPPQLAHFQRVYESNAATCATPAAVAQLMCDLPSPADSLRAWLLHLLGLVAHDEYGCADAGFFDAYDALNDLPSRVVLAANHIALRVHLRLPLAPALLAVRCRRTRARLLCAAARAAPATVERMPPSEWQLLQL